MSLSLVIFAELFCSVAFVSGFMFRLTPLPMIFSMGVALFGIHAADPFAMKELAFVYFAMFVLLYITGPGRYSLDHFIGFGLRSAALSAVPPASVNTVQENPAPVVSRRHSGRDKKAACSPLRGTGRSFCVGWFLCFRKP